jgi:GST-like protein
MGNVGPFFGQANHFNRYAPEPVPYAIARYNNEANRLLGVMDRRLAAHGFFGPEYGIADMALFGWTRDFAKDEAALAELPNVRRWYDTILERAAVQRGLAVTVEGAGGGVMDDEAKAILFGDKQYARR